MSHDVQTRSRATRRDVRRAYALVATLGGAGCAMPGAPVDAAAPAADHAVADDVVRAADDAAVDAADEAQPLDATAARDAAMADASRVLAAGVVARVIAPDFLNLRNGPSNADTIITPMPCGASVTLLGGPTDVWWNVRYGSQAGWASGSYLVPEALFDPSVCPSSVDAGAGADAGTLDVPAALVARLSVTPYVEESCTPTTYPGWPYPAQRCTYGAGLVVIVADPSADRVARWIVDSAAFIPALAGLRTRDPAHYEQGLEVIATNVLDQSSRIFPLHGQIREDIVYDFQSGVTSTCSTGCYCRVNSISRPEWCHYNDVVLHAQPEAACLATYSTTSYTAAWAQHCLDNEVAAWTVDANPHFRARAFDANANSIAARFPDPATADGAAVVTALRAEFPGA